MIFVWLIAQLIEFIALLFMMIVMLVISPTIVIKDFYNSKRGVECIVWIVGPLTVAQRGKIPNGGNSEMNFLHQ